MITRNTLALLALLTATIRVSAAGEITVTAAEIASLGIELSTPQMVNATTAIEATARIAIPPMGDVLVSAPQEGLLVRLYAAVGDEIVRGQVMAELTAPGFLALQREFLDALNTNLLAQNEFERDQQLHDEGIVSGRRLQETATRARIAATGINEHRQLLKMSGLTDAEIHALEREQRLLATLSIRAPIDGVVLDRMASAGERVDTMSAVYRIADLSVLWVEIAVPREKLPLIRQGMQVTIAGHPAHTSALVISIARSVDPATQTVTVRAVLSGSAHGLSPGEFLSARIIADDIDAPATSFWVVPATAVVRRDDDHFVFVRTASGFEIRRVDVVNASADDVYLSSDLGAGTVIAERGVSTLKALWSAQSESG